MMAWRMARSTNRFILYPFSSQKSRSKSRILMETWIEVLSFSGTISHTYENDVRKD